MPCAGPDYSCNSLLSVRLPLGEIRLGAPDSAKPAPRPIWPIIRTYRASREALAHRRQRLDLRALDHRLLRDVGLSQAVVKRESRGLPRPPMRAIFTTLRAGLLWLGRQRLRYAARELDQGLLDRIEASNPEAAREIRALFGIRTDSR